MTLLNATPPQYQVLVGELDITPFIIAFTMRSPELDIKSPIVLQGSITLLEDGRGRLGESLDDFVNTDRWAEGKHPVQVYFSGTLVATLRIRSYSCQEENDRFLAQIELSQLLDLVSYRTPPEDYRTINSGCSATPVRSVVSSLLSSAGLTSCDVSVFPELTGIPAPDRVGQSYIELAQLILGERGYWLYHKPDEQVAISRQWDKLSTPLFSRAKSKAMEFSRLSESSLRYRLPRKYRVTGGGDIFDRCSGNSYGIATGTDTVEIYGELEKTAESYSFTNQSQDSVDASLTNVFRRGLIERRISVTTTNSLKLITETTTTYQTFTIQDEKGKDYKKSLYKTSVVTYSKYYDDQGRLVKEVTSKSTIAKDLFPGTVYEQYPKALLWIDNAESQTIEYLSDPRKSPMYERGSLPSRNYQDNVLRLKTDQTIQIVLRIYQFKTTKKVFNLATRMYEDNEVVSTRYFFSRVAKQLIIESWVESCFSVAEPAFKYERFVYVGNKAYTLISSTSKFAPSELVIDQKNYKTEEDATPPNWSTRPALCPRKKAKLNEVIEVPYPGSASGTFLDTREFEYQCQSINTTAEAQNLAQLFGDLNIGRSFGYQLSLPLREATQWIADPSPNSIAWVHDRVLLLENWSLAITGSGASTEGRISWQAATIGKLSSAIPDPSLPPSPDPMPTGLTPDVIRFNITTEIKLNFSEEVVGATGYPDLATILIDSDGSIITSGGYVQASVNQNLFAQIIVGSDDEVAVASDGNMVTSRSPYEDDFWDSIITIDGDPITINGVLVQD